MVHREWRFLHILYARPVWRALFLISHFWTPNPPSFFWVGNNILTNEVHSSFLKVRASNEIPLDSIDFISSFDDEHVYLIQILYESNTIKFMCLYPQFYHNKKWNNFILKLILELVISCPLYQTARLMKRSPVSINRCDGAWENLSNLSFL